MSTSPRNLKLETQNSQSLPLQVEKRPAQRRLLPARMREIDCQVSRNPAGRGLNTSTRSPSSNASSMSCVINRIVFESAFAPPEANAAAHAASAHPVPRTARPTAIYHPPPETSAAAQPAAASLRQRARPRLLEPLQTEQGQELPRLLARRLAAAARQLRPQYHILKYRPPRQQRVPLRHITEPPLPRRRIRQQLTVQNDPAPVRLLQTRQQPQQRRLSTSRSGR